MFCTRTKIFGDTNACLSYYSLKLKVTHDIFFQDLIMILYLLFDVWPSIKLFRIHCAIKLTIFFDFNFEAVNFRFCSTKNNRAIYRFKIKTWNLTWRDQDFRWRTKIQDFRNCILSFLFFFTLTKILINIKFCKNYDISCQNLMHLCCMNLFKHFIKMPKSQN